MSRLGVLAMALLLPLCAPISLPVAQAAGAVTDHFWCRCRADLRPYPRLDAAVGRRRKEKLHPPGLWEFRWLDTG